MIFIRHVSSSGPLPMPRCLGIVPANRALLPGIVGLPGRHATIPISAVGSLPLEPLSSTGHCMRTRDAGANEEYPPQNGSPTRSPAPRVNLAR
jgi:hypothetical protein